MTLQVFHEKRSNMEFYFVKSVDMELAAGDGIMKNDRKLVSKFLLRFSKNIL